MDQSQINKVFRMWNDGMKVDEIARRFNVNTTEINRIIHPPKVKYDASKYSQEEIEKHREAGQKMANTKREKYLKEREEKIIRTSSFFRENLR